jgi:hypothetical protein
MKVGDLVKIKYDGVVALVTRIESVANFYKSVTTPTVWYHLLNQPVPFKANKLEVIHESR